MQLLLYMKPKVLILQTAVYNLKNFSDILRILTYSTLSTDCIKAHKEHNWSLGVSKAREKEETVDEREAEKSVRWEISQFAMP